MKAGRNQQVVMRLIEAVSANDIERIQSFYCEDSVFSAMPGADAVGQKAIWDIIAMVHDNAESVDWQVDDLCESDTGSVLTEGRVRYLIDGDWHEYVVNGAFEVRGSKITQWH